jgi:hypothetical protein
MQEDLMNSEISSRTACLTEITSNPKSFFNCPDMHGGSGLPEDRFNSETLKSGNTETLTEEVELLRRWHVQVEKVTSHQ